MASAAPRMFAGLAVLLLAGWLGLALFGGGQPEAPITRWTSSRDCRPCHEQVYTEWEDSWHAKSFIDPDVREQSGDFSNTDCIDCHAPKEIFTTGVGKRVLPRSNRRVEGVDCIACHLLPSGEVAGTLTNSTAPCRPVATIDLQRPEYCGVCHNQHKTVDQWRQTHYAEEAPGVSNAICPTGTAIPTRGAFTRWLGATTSA